MKNSGNNENMIYTDEQQASNKKKRNRSRNVIWFNPPFSQSVKTNIGSKFLNLIDKHFKNTPLQKFFNRKTIRISYSCLPNLGSIISGHNKRILNEDKNTGLITSNCNCQKGTKSCPLNGNCLSKDIVYKANVSSSLKTSVYIGLAASTFKERFRNHVQSFTHTRYENNTCLSKEVWNLNRQKINFDLSWSVLGKAASYNPENRFCKLCNLEKTMILTSKEILNKRRELLNKCRHRDKFLLSKFVT